MKVTPLRVTAFQITEAPRMGMLNVFLRDTGPGEGSIIIQDGAEVFSYWWGGMGDEKIREFLLKAPVDYLVEKITPLHRQRTTTCPYTKRVVEAVLEALTEIPRTKETCDHMEIVPSDPKDIDCSYPVCKTCGQHFPDWYCPKNPPTHACEYEDDDECCIHCGEPDERK